MLTRAQRIQRLARKGWPPRSFVSIFQRDGTIKLKQDESALMQLPVELILLIGKYLEAADVACLALACKPLFAIFNDLADFRAALRRDVRARGMFLSRLETETLGLVYSPHKKTLSRFNREGKVDIKTTRLWWLTLRFFHLSPWSNLNTAITMQSWAAITYEQTRLIRNYQLFGPQHGIPPSLLSREYRRKKKETQFMKRPCQVRGEGAQKLRWIDGELFLCRTKTISLQGLKKKKKTVSVSALRDLLCEERAMLCHHWNFDGFQESDPRGVMLDHFRKVCGKLASYSPFRSSGSCDFCETDWDISISLDGFGGLVIALTTWHNLGCCSFPYDRKWEMIVSFVGDARGVRNGTRGNVRQRWKEADLESFSSSGGSTAR
ncbi:hypothetical protein F5Y12DRAFT_510287 [Xylaria sp. FL1777]|nr:hypothetical protein F5Y12DRAFT_510287 [Xylaria sp. FL1777]